VRLKAGTNKVVDAERLFQFLLVRLKAQRPFFIEIVAPLFQFLLVRLKEGNVGTLDDYFAISIPSGAIKSQSR